MYARKGPFILYHFLKDAPSACMHMTKKEDKAKVSVNLISCTFSFSSSSFFVVRQKNKSDERKEKENSD